MRHHDSKLDRANVIAGFTSQQDAEEALFGLWTMGIRDRRIGYYYPIGNGWMADLLANHHRVAASVIGGFVGTAAGIGIGILLAGWNYPLGQSPDPLGLEVTCAVFGALLFGTIGGILGLWTARPGEFAELPAGINEPFLIAVDAGDRKDQVWAVIRRHGGYELRSDRRPQPSHVVHIPTGQLV